jgi:murein DD-endopeptidase MepM/ murein hydrolase activator NlpD
MAETVEVKARLTATNEASAVIKGLQRDLNNLKKKLNVGRGQKAAALTDSIIDPNIQKFLEKKSGSLARVTQSYAKEARRLRDAGQLSVEGFRNLIDQIRVYEKKYNSATGRQRKLTQAQTSELRKLVAQAKAYQLVYNESVGMIGRIQNKIGEMLGKGQRKTLNQQLKDIRYLSGVKKNTAARELAAQNKMFRLDRYRASVRSRSEALEAKAEKKRQNELFGNIRSKARLMENSARLERRQNAERERAAARQRASIMASARGGVNNLRNVGRTADGNFFNSPAFYGMAATGAAAAATTSFIREGVALDKAETFGRMHMNAEMFEGGRNRFEWAYPQSAELGVNPDVLTKTMVEAAKAGVPDNLAQETSELVSKLANIFEVSVPEAMNSVAFAIAQESGAGRLDTRNIDGVRKLLNMTAYLTSTSAARPDQMFSALRTGLGSGAALGMDQAHTLAFLTTAVEAGAQGQQASRFLATFASRMNRFGNRYRSIAALSPANRSDEQDLMLRLPRLLGFRNLRGMLKEKNENPNEFAFKVLEGLNKVEDFETRNAASFLLFGQDFSRFYNNMINSIGIQRDRIRGAKFAANQPGGNDFIEQSFNRYREGYEYSLNRMSAIWSSMKAEFGDSIKPMVDDVSDFLNHWFSTTGTGGFKARFRALFDGLIAGFGFTDMRAMLDSMGVMGANDPKAIKSFFDFAKGFAEGIGVVGSSLKTVFKVVGDFLGIDANSAEGMGKLIAMILGFSVALHFLRPLLSVFGGVASFLLALGQFSMVAGKLLAPFAAMAAGKLGFTGLAAALAGSFGGLLAGGIMIAGLVAGAAALSVVIMNWDEIKAWFSGTSDAYDSAQAVKDGINKRIKVPDAFDLIPDLKSWIFGSGNSNAADLPAVGSKAQSSSVLPSYLQGNAEYMSFMGLQRSMDGMAESFDKVGAKIQLASINPGAIGFGGSTGSIPGIVGGMTSASSGSSPWNAGRALLNSTPGGRLPFAGLDRGGIIGRDIRASGSMGTFLDFIGQAEGTDRGRGYNETLGYGKFTGGPVDLVNMTLDEVDALQTKMLAHPENNFNSSAAGRYQIVRRTLRSLRQQLGLKGDEKFDGPMQDKLATHLARGRGANAAGLMNEWEGLRRYSPQEILQNYNGASTSAAAGVGAVGQAAADSFYPLVGTQGRISSPYGMRRHPIHGDMRMHNGVDIAAPAGTAVQAMLGGEVTKVNKYGDVTVKHADGSTKTYRHIAPVVREGQSIEAGTSIGSLRHGRNVQGGDPRSTGPHLHLEATDAQGNRIDPTSLIRNVPASANTASSITGGVPLPPTRPAGLSGVGSPSGPVKIDIHIDGANQNPEQVASLLERRLSEQWNWRAHDVEQDIV